MQIAVAGLTYWTVVSVVVGKVQSVFISYEMLLYFVFSDSHHTVLTHTIANK